MTRRTYIERIRRLIYGGQPADDANITVGMVNNLLGDAIAAAAKQNYKDNIALDGIAYVNNSFYSTFKNLSISQDDLFKYKIELPQIPIGIGTSDGVPILKIKDSESKQLSQNVVFISENQRSFYEGMRDIPNKIIAYSEGKYIYINSTLGLTDFTANVTMVSGGLSSNLDSELTVPPDYIPFMDDYLVKKLLLALSVKQDGSNDGRDVNPDA